MLICPVTEELFSKYQQKTFCTWRVLLVEKGHLLKKCSAKNVPLFLKLCRNFYILFTHEEHFCNILFLAFAGWYF